MLKGGTAINLTIFDLPRLSVDIDFDYTPNHPLEIMLERKAEDYRAAARLSGIRRIYDISRIQA